MTLFFYKRLHGLAMIVDGLIYFFSGRMIVHRPINLYTARTIARRNGAMMIQD